MPVSNYQTGFVNGVSIRNVPVINTRQGSSQVFWVDSTHALAHDAINYGAFDRPFKTLRYAISRCTHGEPDIIYVGASHTEDVFEDLKINKRNLNIVGLGQGEDRPTFSIQQLATTSTAIRITEKNIFCSNLIFRGDKTGLVVVCSVEHAYVTLDNVKLESAVTTPPTCYLYLDGATHPADHFSARGLEIFMDPSSGLADAGVQFTHAINDVTFDSCIMSGGFINGCIYGPSGITVRNFKILGAGYYRNSGDIRALLVRTCIGGTISTDTHAIGNSSHENSIEVSGVGRGVNGDIYIYTRQIAATLITTTGHELTDPFPGAFYVDDICLETDGTGLGTGTNIIVEKHLETLTYGSPIYLEEAISNLGAYKTVSFQTATIKGQPGTMTSGRFRVRATGANLSGGFVKITLKLRLLQDNSGFENN